MPLYICSDIIFYIYGLILNIWVDIQIFQVKKTLKKALENQDKLKEDIERKSL